MAGRVVPAAEQLGAEYYEPAPDVIDGMEDNRQWINDKMDQDYEIVDIGPAPGRANYPEATSEFYKMELGEIQAREYENFSKIEPAQENVQDSTDVQSQAPDPPPDPPPPDAPTTDQSRNLDVGDGMADQDETAAETISATQQPDASSAEPEWKHDLGEGIADRNEAAQTEVPAPEETAVAETGPESEIPLDEQAAANSQEAQPEWQQDLGEGIADREPPPPPPPPPPQTESESSSMSM